MARLTGVNAAGGPRGEMESAPSTTSTPTKGNHMKRLALIMAAAGFALALPTLANEDLAKKSGCLNCHNVSGAKKMAPALNTFASKGEEALVAGINDKKKHGSVKASDDEKKQLAKWVATLK